VTIVSFYDTETTGKNEPEHRFVEATIMDFDLSTGQHIDTWTRRFNPMRRIDAKALAVHGITLDELAAEPTFDLLAPELIERLNRGALTCAHNGDFFDFPFTIRELIRVGHPYTFRRTFDTMTAGRWATGNGKIPTLGELCRSLDVPYDPAKAHSAEYDVSVMAACFFEARRLGYWQIEGL
jgi:DNA polymerase-3 subunit epsilon